MEYEEIGVRLENDPTYPAADQSMEGHFRAWMEMCKWAYLHLLYKSRRWCNLFVTAQSRQMQREQELIDCKGIIHDSRINKKERGHSVSLNLNNFP